YYVREPAASMLAEVRQAIGVDIEAHDRAYWLSFFARDELEDFASHDFVFDRVDPEQVNNFCDAILSRPHLAKLSSAARAVLDERYRKFLHLFNENLSHMGFTVLTLQNVDPTIDRQLF